ncbi:hypothetical protein HYS10_01140 [Candidatus Collierbacteria bacterium]|nr:hypothetical protein [Candidatus Collierbacteria bacterium]
MTKKAKQKTTKAKTAVKTYDTYEVQPVEETKPKSKFFTYLVIVVLLGTALFLLAKKYRGLVIAGMVNTTPISSFELQNALVDRYGKATLDDIIANKLLVQLAKSNQIVVTPEDVKTEIASLEERLGGKEALEASMERFGIDEAKLNEEINTVLIQKKLSEKLFKAEVSDSDITKYYQDNKSLFEGKKFDDVKAGIQENLVQQKLQEQFGKWFQEQRQKAKITIFI